MTEPTVAKSMRLRYIKIVALVYLIGIGLSALLGYMEVQNRCQGQYLAWVPCVFIVLGLLQSLFELPLKRVKQGTPETILRSITETCDIRLEVIEKLHHVVLPKFLIALMFILTGWGLKIYLPLLLSTFFCMA